MYSLFFLMFISYPGEMPDLPTLDTAQLSDFVLKSGEFFTSAITSIKQLTQQELLEDQPKITKESTLLFVKSSELQPTRGNFKGDRGMSREEDQDLYATRGWTIVEQWAVIYLNVIHSEVLDFLSFLIKQDDINKSLALFLMNYVRIWLVGQLLLKF